MVVPKNRTSTFPSICITEFLAVVLKFFKENRLFLNLRIQKFQAPRTPHFFRGGCVLRDPPFAYIEWGFYVLKKVGIGDFSDFAGRVGLISTL